MEYAKHNISQYLDVLLEAICVVNKEGVFVYVSSGCERIFGYTSDELVGQAMISLVHPDDRERTLQTAKEIMDGDCKIDFENRYIRKDGSVVDILWSAQWSATDRVRVAVARDVTHTKQTLERLQRIAFFDPLTALPNRQLFKDRLQMAMSRVRREHKQLAVLFIDLDKFKQVNDVFGHLVGDTLLIDVAHRIQQQVRETDTVARFGGDEFVLLLDSIDNAQQAQAIATKITLALRQPFSVEQQRVAMPASVGVAIYPLHGDTADKLLHYADSAMYRAKKAGGNQVHD